MKRRYICLILFASCLARGHKTEILCRLDLANYGFAPGAPSVFYSSLTFLSDSSLLVSVVQSPIQKPSGSPYKGALGGVARISAPTDSRLLVFDIPSNRVISDARMRVRMSGVAVHYAANGRFVVSSGSGIRLCSASLQCGKAIQAGSLARVSPAGTTAVTESRRKSVIIDLQGPDPVALRQPEGTGFDGEIIPGDDALLMKSSGGTSAFIRRRGKPDREINLAKPFSFPAWLFLDSKKLGHPESPSDAVISDLEGKEVYRLLVEKVWRSSFIPTALGNRFGVFEQSYTKVNAILNFWDIDDARLRDLQRLRIVDTASGSKLADLQWDPRPSQVTPALSPSGRLLARVIGSSLEVVSIP